MEITVNHDLKDRSTVEYCRKSTESEERQAFSLRDQHEANKKVGERVGLKVKKLYTESMSAKKRGRPLFNEMVEGIENGKYQVILVWALNRLGRNAVDGAMLIELMDEDKLLAIVTSGKTYNNTGEDKLLLSIEFGLAKKYSDDLGPVVRRGMYSKLKRGWWPGCPKLGYLNVKYNNEESVQVVDPDRFPLLKKAIDRLLTRGYSVGQVVKKLNDEGFRTRRTKKQGGIKLNISSFYKLLNDPFCYGQMVWGDQTERVHESLPRLMTEDEYWQVQKLMGRRGVPRPHRHLDIPFRGTVICGLCGCSITPYVKEKVTRKGIKKYYFAMCTKKNRDLTCNEPQMSLSDLETQILSLINKVSIHPRFAEWALDWLKKSHGEEAREQREVLNNLNGNLAAYQRKLNNLLDLRIEGQVTPEVYTAKKEELTKEREQTEKELSGLKFRTDDWLSRAEKTFNFAVNARYSFETALPEEKTAMLKTLGSNFILKSKKLSLDLDKPFFVFKENQELVNANPVRLELGEEVDITAKKELPQALISKWSG